MTFLLELTAVTAVCLLAGYLASRVTGGALQIVAPFDREQITAALMAAREEDADIEGLVESLKPREAAKLAKCSKCEEMATVRYVEWRHLDIGHRVRYACALHWTARRQGFGLVTWEELTA